MKEFKEVLKVVVLGFGLVGMLTSCQKGSAEKAGAKIDEAVQDTKDLANDVKEDVTKKR